MQLKQQEENNTNLLKQLKLIKRKQIHSLLGWQQWTSPTLLVRIQKVTTSLHHNLLESLNLNIDLMRNVRSVNICIKFTSDGWMLRSCLQGHYDEQENNSPEDLSFSRVWTTRHQEGTALGRNPFFWQLFSFHAVLYFGNPSRSAHTEILIRSIQDVIASVCMKKI